MAYPIGSVSKSITATGVMTLINSGQLELSQDIRPMIDPIKLKDVHGQTPKIELWQLLSMNGGLNHAYGVFDTFEDLPSSGSARKTFFETTTIVAFPPGTVYEYSNNSYYVAEIVVENAAKLSFSEFMKKNLFEPLSMSNTHTAHYRSGEKSSLVTTYTGSMKRIEANFGYPTGGSGFWSSLEDLTKYAAFHLGKTKIPETIGEPNLKLMHEFRQGQADLFGIGWFNSGSVLVSNGSVKGGNSHLLVDKENDLTIVCLLNQTSGNSLADQFADKVRRSLVPNLANDGYRQWQRIYATPYSTRYELLGTWKGHITQPMTKKTVPIQLEFDESDRPRLLIDGEEVALNNATFNLFKEFEGGFRSPLPGIYDKETRCGLKLKYAENKLGGYIQYDDLTETRYYRMPLYVELRR